MQTNVSLKPAFSISAAFSCMRWHQQVQHNINKLDYTHPQFLSMDGHCPSTAAGNGVGAGGGIDAFHSPQQVDPAGAAVGGDHSFVLTFQRSSSVRSSITIDNTLKHVDDNESLYPHSVASHSSHHPKFSGILGLRNPLSVDGDEDRSILMKRSTDSSDWEEDSISITSRNLSDTEDCVIALASISPQKKKQSSSVLGLTLKMQHLNASMEDHDDSPSPKKHFNPDDYRESFLSMATLASDDDLSSSSDGDGGRKNQFQSIMRQERERSSVQQDR